MKTRTFSFSRPLLAVLTSIVCLSGCWPGRPSNPAPPPPTAPAPASSPAPAKTCPDWNDAAARYLTPEDFAACSCGALEIVHQEIFAHHGQASQNAFEAENATRIVNYRAAAGCLAQEAAEAAPARPAVETNEASRPVPSAPAASRPVPPRPADRPVPGGNGCPGWEEAASRYLGSGDLQSCSCKDLELLRNEIYARHGRIFNRADLQDYFSAQSWYVPDRGNINGDRGQNQFERRNVTTILNQEKGLGCRGSAANGSSTSSSSGGMAASSCPSWPAPADFRLGPGELQACSCRELELLRNEVFARHGRIFNRQDLQNYFSSQPWYVPDRNNPNGDRGMNNTERNNVTAILNYEKRLGCK